MEIVVPSSAPCLRGGRRDTNILRIQSEYHLLIWSSGDVESSLITHFFLCSVSPHWAILYASILYATSCGWQDTP